MKIQCSCGKIFDCGFWDGEYMPTPQGIFDAIAHIRMYSGEKPPHAHALVISEA